jgi:hypothetical protein
MVFDLVRTLYKMYKIGCNTMCRLHIIMQRTIVNIVLE